MPIQTISIEEQHAGKRLDKVLASALGLGRHATRRLFEEGKVHVGRRQATKGELALVGREVTVEVPELPDGACAVPESHPVYPLNVVLERDDLVVVEKPAGQPTAPLRGGETGTLANTLVACYPEMAEIGFSAREPGLVHRLDTGTSGLVIAARTKLAFSTVVDALKAGELAKGYLALCEDHDMPERGDIEIPLAPHPKDTRRVLACLHPHEVERLAPRPARTSFEVKERVGRLALVSVKAPRAFRHQIRAHLAALGCPIANDVLYGASELSTLGERHALHASSIVWRGGAGVPAFTVRSDLPPELTRVLAGG